METYAQVLKTAAEQNAEAGYSAISKRLLTFTEAATSPLAHDMFRDALGYYDKTVPGSFQFEEINLHLGEYARRTDDPYTLDLVLPHVDPVKRWELLARIGAELRTRPDEYRNISEEDFQNWWSEADQVDLQAIALTLGAEKAVSVALSRVNAWFAIAIAAADGNELDTKTYYQTARRMFDDTIDAARSGELVPVGAGDYSKRSSYTEERLGFAHLAGGLGEWKHSADLGGDIGPLLYKARGGALTYATIGSILRKASNLDVELQVKAVLMTALAIRDNWQEDSTLGLAAPSGAGERWLIQHVEGKAFAKDDVTDLLNTNGQILREVHTEIYYLLLRHCDPDRIGRNSPDLFNDMRRAGRTDVPALIHAYYKTASNSMHSMGNAFWSALYIAEQQDSLAPLYEKDEKRLAVEDRIGNLDTLLGELTHAGMHPVDRLRTVRGLIDEVLALPTTDTEDVATMLFTIARVMLENGLLDNRETRDMVGALHPRVIRLRSRQSQSGAIARIIEASNKLSEGHEGTPLLWFNDIALEHRKTAMTNTIIHSPFL